MKPADTMPAANQPEIVHFARDMTLRWPGARAISSFGWDTPTSSRDRNRFRSTTYGKCATATM